MGEVCFKDRRMLTNSLPWGSLMDPLLLVVFINYLIENVQGTIHKFTDDSKISGIVDGENGCQELQ